MSDARRPLLRIREFATLTNTPLGTVYSWQSRGLLKEGLRRVGPRSPRIDPDFADRVLRGEVVFREDPSRAARQHARAVTKHKETVTAPLKEEAAPTDKRDALRAKRAQQVAPLLSMVDLCEAHALSLIDPRSAAVIIWRTGLDGAGKRTLAESGRLFGVLFGSARSAENVRQRWAKGLRDLRMWRARGVDVGRLLDRKPTYTREETIAEIKKITDDRDETRDDASSARERLQEAEIERLRALLRSRQETSEMLPIIADLVPIRRTAADAARAAADLEFKDPYTYRAVADYVDALRASRSTT